MKALSKIDLFKRLSDILGVAKSAFEDNGVFNGFLNVERGQKGSCRYL
jgi:hypothetical protein